MASSLRNVARRCLAASLVLPVAIVVGAGRATAATTTPLSCSTTASATVSSGGPAYYLFESDGAVVSCGDAPLWGSEAGKHLAAPIVSGAPLAAGTGYLLVGASGAVYPFGSAASYGSPAHLKLASPVVAITPTPDGHGYWIVTAKGNLFHYGDAGFFGSTVHDHADGDVVALLSTPDGNGYWIVSSTGVVHHYGDAVPLGSAAHRRPPIVAAAASSDGRGIVLLTKKGGVDNFGTVPAVGSLIHRSKPRPLTAIATSPDGQGYVAANAAGSIYNFGDAVFAGSLAGKAPRRPTAVVAMGAVKLPTPVLTAAVSTVAATTSAPTTLIPHGAFGYDISNFQCSKPGSATASPSLPASAPFSIIEAAGWLDSSENSCLAAEAAWATAAAGPGGAHYNLYLFLNSPGQSPAAAVLDASGPAGQCATLSPSAQGGCLAYNYGYQGAVQAETLAAAQGVTSPVWWLDVEGTNLSPTQYSNFSAGQYWSSSTTLNDDTIQGAIDGLRGIGATVGIYSTSVQFPKIAGTYVPTGPQVPLWVAGVPWTNPPFTEAGLLGIATLAPWCAGTAHYSGQPGSEIFANGVVWLLQETPGSEPSPYGIDPDYAC